jgi:small multidrug resistance family-3 protein
MIKALQSLPLLLIILTATILEVSGDALVRKGIYHHSGITRAIFWATGAVLLFGYGFFVNLSAIEFGKVAGIYIATLFIVWQVINYIAFHTVPSLPVIVGGSLIIAGGLLITFWKPR